MQLSRSLLSACLLFTFMPALGAAQQNPPPAPEVPKDSAALFAAAQPFYNFTDPSLKPWHLKATYQLYDDTGKQPTEQGTYEYWWASPTVFRSTWTRGSVTYTDWHTSDGKHAYLSTGQGLNFFEYQLQSRLLSPLPESKDDDPSTTYFNRQLVKFGNVKAPCIMIVPKMPSHGQPLTIPLGLFPTYCFDPKIPVLLVETSFGALSVNYGQIVRVQNHYLAKEIVESESGRKILTAAVNTIGGLDPSDSALIPSPEAKTGHSGAVTIGSGIMQGMRTAGQNPIYPQDAKDAHAEGTVILQALIGRDGRIHNLKVTSAPFPSLVESAMWAVSHWEYKPYLLNGEPVDVETQINVIYKLGG